MKELLHVNKLHLQFDTDRKDVLSNISFRQAEGESLLLLGPSGSGKSTLTFCLNGIYPRELDGKLSGDIHIEGRGTDDYQPGELSKHVGVVFQDPETQFCMLTVEDEVAFGLENIRYPAGEMEAKIEEVLSLVDMLQYKKTNIASLSGGQKQKLALACILALEPSLMILDEPTANLDPISTKELIKTIKDLKEKLGFGLIVIEHKLAGWTEICERCLLLNRNGEIFYDGPLRLALYHSKKQLIEEGIWLPPITRLVLESFPDTRYPPLTMEEFERSGEFRGMLNKAKRNSAASENGAPVIMSANQLRWSRKTRQQEIIQNVSLDIKVREFIAIVGSNGSGKTSLSRILAGLQKPSSGSIQLKGRDFSGWRERELRKTIGYVFQNPEHQFIAHTVFDEVAFGLKAVQGDQQMIEEKVVEVLDRCDLLYLRDKHPFSLSQGQKRRLSVATMIVDDQPLLLLDEPTFGQDAHSNAELMGLLENRFMDGSTIVMVTHDMEIVDNYATRVLVMHEGKLVKDTTPEGLWETPAPTLLEWKLELPVKAMLDKFQQRNDCHVSASS